MIFRGQNYLSSAIRQVGRDVGGLSRAQQLTAQRAQLQITGQRLIQSRAIAAAELTSVQTGARRIAQERAVAEQKVAQMRADATLLRNQAQLGRATRAVQAGRPLRGFNMAETVQQQKALQLQVEAATAAINNQQFAVQGLQAREIQLAEREAQLTQIVNTRSRAVELNTQKLNQNAIAMRMLPWDSFQRGAQVVEHTGRVLQMFGLIAGATLGYFADQAAKFNTQIVLAATQSTTASNNTTAQVLANASKLQDAVLKLLASGKTAAKPNELTNALYTIFSGVSLKGNQQQQLREGVSILEQFNKVYTANFGQVQFNDIVKAGIALINNFGLSARSLPNVLNRMQASVRFGAMTLSEFTGSLNQVVPAFRGAHYGFDQMAADIAFVSRLFPSLRTGTTGLARLTEVFARTKVRGGIQEQLGINIAPGGHLLPLNQIVDDIIKARPELAKGGVDLQNFFKTVSGSEGTIQSRRVFVGFATNAKLYHTIARQVLGDNNELTKSFTDMSQTPQVRWVEFTNQLRALILEVGAGAIPAFQALAGPIKHAVEWFNQLSPSTRKLIGYFGAFVAVGALVGGTLLAIGGGIGVIVSGLGKMLTARAVIAGLGSEAGSIALSGALMLGAPVAIYFLIKYHKQVGDVVHALGGLDSVLIAVAAGLLALRIAPALLAIVGIATEANTAAAGVGSLRLMMLALGGPEVLAALAAGAAALALYYGFTHGTDRSTIGTISGSGGERTIVDTMGRLFEHTRTATRGSQKTFDRQLTPEQARALGGNVNLPEHAVRQAIADSPRYQHAIGANQKAVDAFTAALAREAAAQRNNNALDRTAHITPGSSTVRTVQAWISLLENARDKMLGSPNDVQIAKRYEQLQADLNKRFKDQPALLAAINDVLGAYDASVKKATNSTSVLGITTQDVLSGLEGMYKNFLQQETSAFGTLFQGPFVNMPSTQNNLQFGGQLSGQDLFKDLKSQLRQFTTFHAQLNELSKRGAPRELITQLEALGPAALKQIEQLNKLPSGALRGYFKLFQESQKAIHQQTMRDLNEQLAQYRKYGQNIALQIVAGLRDENVHVTNYLQKLITKMFPGLPTGATGAGDRPTHHRAPTHPTIQHTHYHVVAPKDNTSVKAQIRHADFARRHKYSGRGPGTR